MSFAPMKVVVGAMLLQLVASAVLRAGPAPAPAPGPAPGPSMNAVAITFEISNYNYEDLDAPLAEPPIVAQQKQEKPVSAMAGDSRHSNTVEGLTRYAEAVGDQASLLQVGVSLEPLVRDVLRDTVRHTVEEIVEHFLPQATAPGPAPAAAPAQAAFLEAVAPAPAPNSAPAGPPEHHVDVFVQFTPGGAHPLSSGSATGKSTLVEVTISGKPETGVDELPTVMSALSLAKKHGDLQQWLMGAIYEITGLIPTFANLKVLLAKVTQWSNAVCEKHMQRVVKLFEGAYTRRNVPTAIYNECTNFFPSMSFSHDHINNHADEDKCRDATIKFAKRWQFGKNPSGKMSAALLQTPMDFSEVCVDFCEGKYGIGAQQCHVSEGDEISLKAP